MKFDAFFAISLFDGPSWVMKFKREEKTHRAIVWLFVPGNLKVLGGFVVKTDFRLFEVKIVIESETKLWKIEKIGGFRKIDKNILISTVKVSNIWKQITKFLT